MPVDPSGRYAECSHYNKKELEKLISHLVTCSEELKNKKGCRFVAGQFPDSLGLYHGSWLLISIAVLKCIEGNIYAACLSKTPAAKQTAKRVLQEYVKVMEKDCEGFCGEAKNMQAISHQKHQNWLQNPLIIVV
jgi:hypothetical protein